MGKEKDKKYLYRKQVDLFSLIQKLKLWPSHQGILHSIKSFKVYEEYGEVVTHCNKTFVIKNSSNSRACRWLRNKLFYKTCPICKIPDWKLKKYSSTFFSRSKGIQLK